MTRVYFTDRDLGTRFGEILGAAALNVERHRDHFPPACADEIWLREVGRRGWIALIAKVYRPTPGEAARQADARGRIELWHPKP